MEAYAQSLSLNALNCALLVGVKHVRFVSQTKPNQSQLHFRHQKGRDCMETKTKQCCLCGKSGHDSSECDWRSMIITKTKCQACGCYGIHACLGKVVPSTAKLDFTKLDEFICRKSNQS